MCIRDSLGPHRLRVRGGNRNLGPIPETSVGTLCGLWSCHTPVVEPAAHPGAFPLGHLPRRGYGVRYRPLCRNEELEFCHLPCPVPLLGRIVGRTLVLHYDKAADTVPHSRA